MRKKGKKKNGNVGGRKIPKGKIVSQEATTTAPKIIVDNSNIYNENGNGSKTHSIGDNDEDNNKHHKDANICLWKRPMAIVFVLGLGVMLSFVFVSRSEEVKQVLDDGAGVVQTLQEQIHALDQQLQRKLQERVRVLERQLNRTFLGNASSTTAATEKTGSSPETATRPGLKLRELGAEAKHPVVIVPGFVTTGLELWDGDDCARKYFRQRLWAALGMVQSIIQDRDCWTAHMRLDPLTGGDPPGRAKIRAAEGFAAADYFMANYWVWAKLIENLADVGYTSSTMSMAPYDWRLAFPLLEERDGYFTRLKSEIETLHKTTGHKIVLLSHSMGGLVVHYFMAWATNSVKDGGGGLGKKWIDRHVHAYINIAAPLLGVPKAAAALLSGEMCDTAMLGAMGPMVEQFYGRRMRRDLFTTWGSLWNMLPMGGDAIWGTGADLCDARSPEDPFCPVDNDEPSPLILRKEPGNNISGSDDSVSGALCDDGAGTIADQGGDNTCAVQPSSLDELLKEFSSGTSWTGEEVNDFLRTWGGGYGTNLHATKTYGPNLKDGAKKTSSMKTKSLWHDPSRTPLPHAPNMRLYCMYGTGLPTERAYYYKPDTAVENNNKFVNGENNRNTNSNNNTSSGADDKQRRDDDASNNASSSTGGVPLIMDLAVNDAGLNTSNGVRFVDGDKSVPLLSLGYLCYDAWRRKDSGLNPSRIPVTTREVENDDGSGNNFIRWNDPGRGGPYSGEHVDTLGNIHVIEDVLRVSTDFGSDEVRKDRIVSDIKNLVDRVNNRGGRERKAVGRRRKRTFVMKKSI